MTPLPALNIEGLLVALEERLNPAVGVLLALEVEGRLPADYVRPEECDSGLFAQV